ncbi:MAG: YhbY family RNA-binding protein [Candidatus Thorarchaeota archaeon]
MKDEGHRHRLICISTAAEPIHMVGPDPIRIKITWQEPAMMQVGKAGVSDSVVEEAKRLLKRHQYIKVRMLRSAIGELSKSEIVGILCEKTGARLAGVRGNTAVIYKTRGSRSD